MIYYSSNLELLSKFLRLFEKINDFKDLPFGLKTINRLYKIEDRICNKKVHYTFAEQQLEDFLSNKNHRIQILNFITTNEKEISDDVLDVEKDAEALLQELE